MYALNNGPMCQFEVVCRHGKRLLFQWDSYLYNYWTFIGDIS